ncbi:MAG: ADP-ribosylglycohydrolase family protein, partial [Methanobrevibacter sp.]|nr:ADP-ribosylglycohydrolase family protein [Methanobrevibacter sp.]
MKGIIGAISGDVIGSVYEHRPIKTKEFNLFSHYSQFTDDTVMTLAIAKWLCEDKTSKDVLIKNLKYFGKRYPNAGYGGRFYHWLKQESPEPYGSWANGSAMRVSPCAWVAGSLEEAQELAKTSAVVTHNHADGVIGALATSDAIYLARVGASKDEIRDHVELRYDYNLSLSLDEIRPSY